MNYSLHSLLVMKTPTKLQILARGGPLALPAHQSTNVSLGPKNNETSVKSVKIIQVVLQQKRSHSVVRHFFWKTRFDSNAFQSVMLIYKVTFSIWRYRSSTKFLSTRPPLQIAGGGFWSTLAPEGLHGCAANSLDARLSINTAGLLTRASPAQCCRCSADIPSRLGRPRAWSSYSRLCLF